LPASNGSSTATNLAAEEPRQAARIEIATLERFFAEMLDQGLQEPRVRAPVDRGCGRGSVRARPEA
jgi:hypothetical protein